MAVEPVKTTNPAYEPDHLAEKLAALIGKDKVARTTAERIVYQADGFTMAKGDPAAVVHPATTEEVQAVVRFAHENGIPFVARGAGTGLSGGALVREGGIIISIAGMRQILDIDIRNRRITAQAGVVNLRLTQQVTANNYHFAPDPSSQMACTLGGNVAENAGGPHTLKYGVTTNHVLGMKMVLPDGSLLDIPGDTDEPLGYDLLGIVTGSEGTFGIVTEVTVKLTHLPESKRTALAVFDSVDDATQAVTSIISAGIIPAALEMMDSTVIEAVEAAFQFGFPLDAGAVLICEIDGLEVGLDEQFQRTIDLCTARGAREIRIAHDEDERTALWMARKKAVGSLGRLAPSHCTQDGVVPRSKLPDILRRINEIGKSYGLRIANLFHAGDGSLHPIVLYDHRDPEQTRRVLECGGDILKVCVDMGGTITGEHGVGVEKLDFMKLVFSEVDIDTMSRIRSVFNPKALCNPDKVLPTRAGCIELMLHKKGVH